MAEITSNSNVQETPETVWLGCQRTNLEFKYHTTKEYRGNGSEVSCGGDDT